MIQAGVGLSTGLDTARAAREAAAQAAASLPGNRADLAIVFATSDHAADLSVLVREVADAVGTTCVTGCSASGVLALGRECENGPAIGVLAVQSDALRATPFLLQDRGDYGLSAGIHLGQRLAASRDDSDLVVVWPDPYAIRPDRLLQGLDAALGPVPVAGGASSSRSPSGGTFQFCGTEGGTGAVSGVRLSGAFRHHLALTQGCRPLGAVRRVTGAHERFILEVDGVPAYEALRACAPGGRLDNPADAIRRLTVALLPEPGESTLRPGEFLVRNIVAADPDTGVIAIAAEVEEGQSLLFAVREPGAAYDDVSKMAARAAESAPEGGYRFGLYFDCLARGSALYGRAGVDSEAIARHLPGVPILGFFCNAEIAPLRGANHLFTYTGVLVLVSE